MRPIQFGFCVPIFAAPGGLLFRTPNYAQLDAITTLNIGVLADTLGYDSLWVADHLMLGHNDAILEGWTTLSALSGATKHAKLGMIHMGHFFRYPAMIAKMTATLDQLSGGRYIHFIDGGNRPSEYAAYGLPWFEPLEERISRMVDGLKLTMALWTKETPVTYNGTHYQIKDAICTPRPAQTPHPPIWMGETRLPVLEACVKYAQGWNTVPVTIPALREKLQTVKTACDRVGRAFDTIEKSLEMQILIAPDLKTIRQQLTTMIAHNPPEKPDQALSAFLSGATDTVPESLARIAIVGTPDSVATQVQAYIDEGISHFMFWFMDMPNTEGLHLFMDQVAPQWR